MTGTAAFTCFSYRVYLGRTTKNTKEDKPRQNLHYNALDLDLPPPPETYLAPPPPDQLQAEKPHDYTLRINGQEPQQPKSLFQSTAFKAAGVFIAVIVGYLAYLFVFLPK